MALASFQQYLAVALWHRPGLWLILGASFQRTRSLEGFLGASS
ncbi:MAG TPA: hypothetical protein V6C85_02230 [Allocoleopsis sp.]